MVTEPRDIVPFLKVTVPVGVRTKPVTVAVNVTDWPNALGLTDDMTAVVVKPTVTFCVNGDEVLVVKLVSPP